ncbi:MAG: hypothetical protein ACKO34_04965 [Vampirovibrionales bacterium]
MGLSATQARVMGLTAQKNDLELTQQQINAERMRLTNQMNELFNLSANLDPNSDESKTINLRLNAIFQLDKAMQLQLERIQTQYSMVTAELDGLKKQIEKQVKAIFTVFG